MQQVDYRQQHGNLQHQNSGSYQFGIQPQQQYQQRPSNAALNVKDPRGQPVNNSDKSTSSEEGKVYLQRPVRTFTKQIIFMRHGQTEESTKSIVLGQTGGNLSKKGQAEAQLIGRFIQKARIDLAIVSDLKRCMETLQIVEGEMLNKIPVTRKEPLIRDINLGKYQGTSVKDQKTFKVLKEMNYSRDKKAEKNAECWNDFEQRAVKFWKNLVDNYLTKETFKQILVISHKGFITTLLENAYLSDIDIDDSIKFFNMPLNAGEMIVIKTEFVNNQLRMIDFQRKIA